MESIDKSKPLVSVVIPVYRTEKYLAKCLDSVSYQSYTNFEAIVVDDGSPDNSNALAQIYCDRDKRFVLIRQTNQGLSGARNTGIKKATGKYILFLDSDDALVSDAIEGMVSIAEDDNADMVIPDRYYKIIESTGKKKLEFHFTKNEFIANPVEFVLRVMISKGRAWRAHSLIYSASVIKKNNICFPVGYTQEDIIFNLRFSTYAEKVSFYKHPTVFYLKRLGSITTSYNSKLFDVFLFIDEQIDLFLINNKINDIEGQKSKNTLFYRNMILVLTGIMSNGNNVAFRNKYKEAKKLINTVQDIRPLKYNYIGVPFFTDPLKTLYFRTLTFLICYKVNSLAIMAAWFTGKFYIRS